jgi:hypothetical protein
MRVLLRGDSRYFGPLFLDVLQAEDPGFEVFADIPGQDARPWDGGQVDVEVRAGYPANLLGAPWPVFLLFDPPGKTLQEEDFCGAATVAQFASLVARRKVVPVISSAWSAAAFRDCGVRPVLLPRGGTVKRAEVADRRPVLAALGIPVDAYHFICPVTGDGHLLAVLAAFFRLRKLGLRATLALHARDAREQAVAVSCAKKFANRSEIDRRLLKEWASAGFVNIVHQHAAEHPPTLLYAAHDCCVNLDSGPFSLPETWTAQHVGLAVISSEEGPVSDQGSGDRVAMIPSGSAPSVIHLEESMLRCAARPPEHQAAPGPATPGPWEIVRLMTHEKQWEEDTRTLLERRWPGPI